MQLTECKHRISVEFLDTREQYYSEAQLLDCENTDYQYGNTEHQVKDYDLDYFLKPFGYPAFQKISYK